MGASHSRSSSISSELEKNLSTRSEDEGFGSPSILPTIPTVLARPHHRLNQSWSLWYNRGDSSLSWAENQKMVGTVRTAEEFSLHREEKARLETGAERSD